MRADCRCSCVVVADNVVDVCDSFVVVLIFVCVRQWNSSMCGAANLPRI